MKVVSFPLSNGINQKISDKVISSRGLLSAKNLDASTIGELTKRAGTSLDTSLSESVSEVFQIGSNAAAYNNESFFVFKDGNFSKFENGLRKICVESSSVSRSELSVTSYDYYYDQSGGIVSFLWTEGKELYFSDYNIDTKVFSPRRFIDNQVLGSVKLDLVNRNFYVKYDKEVTINDVVVRNAFVRNITDTSVTAAEFTVSEKNSTIYTNGTFCIYNYGSESGVKGRLDKIILGKSLQKQPPLDDKFYADENILQVHESQISDRFVFITRNADDTISVFLRQVGTVNALETIAQSKKPVTERFSDNDSLFYDEEKRALVSSQGYTHFFDDASEVWGIDWGLQDDLSFKYIPRSSFFINSTEGELFGVFGANTAPYFAPFQIPIRKNVFKRGESTLILAPFISQLVAVGDINPQTAIGLKIVILGGEDCKTTSATVADNTIISNTMLMKFDGSALTENGFLHAPFIRKVTDSTDYDMKGIIDGVRNYAVIFKAIDSKGYEERSAAHFQSVSFSYITNNPPTPDVTLEIIGLQETLKRSHFIEVYRTATNGQNYFRIGVIQAEKGGIYTYTDTTSDDDLAGNELAYFNSRGQNITPPAGDFIATNDARLAISGVEQSDNEVFISRPFFEDGSEALTFDATINLIFPSKVRAISKLDSRFIIFTEDKMYWWGEGYQRPVELTAGTTVPIDNFESILETRLGLVFKSRKGFYLLDRGLNINYIGALIEDYNKRQVVSSVSDPTSERIAFLFDKGDVVVFDTFTQNWTERHYRGATDIFVLEGKIGYSDSRGRIYIEDDLIADDDGRPIETLFETGFFQLNDLQGSFNLNSINLMGVFFPNTKVTIEIRYNNEENYTQSVEKVVNSTIGSVEDGTPAFGVISNVKEKSENFTIRFRPNRRSSDIMSVAFKISENTTNKVRYNAISFEFSPNRKLRRVR